MRLRENSRPSSYAELIEIAVLRRWNAEARPRPAGLRRDRRALGRSTLPPPPVRVQAPPLGMALAVLTYHDSEAYAGLAITLFAELVKADQLGLSSRLGTHSARSYGRDADERQRGGVEHKS